MTQPSILISSNDFNIICHKLSNSYLSKIHVQVISFMKSFECIKNNINSFYHNIYVHIYVNINYY